MQNWYAVQVMTGKEDSSQLRKTLLFIMDFINPVGDKKQIPREHWPLFAVPLPVVTLHPLVFRGEAVFQDLRVYHPLTGNTCGILFSVKSIEAAL